MKIYTTKTDNSLQVWRKYLLEFDSRITSLVNLIDFINPNFLILNYQYNTSNICVYTEDQLVELGILEKEGEIVTQINAWKLQPHHGLINYYGDNIPVATKEGQVSFSMYWNRGFCILNDGNTETESKISIYAWATSGTYYVLTAYKDDFTKWIYFPNATDRYGSVYTFSLCLGGSRIYYHGESNSLTGDLHSLNRMTQEVPELFTWTFNAEKVFLTTLQQTYWNADSCLLMHELITLEQTSESNEKLTYDMEEVFCDEEHVFGTNNLDNRSVSYYNIATNIDVKGLFELYCNFY